MSPAVAVHEGSLPLCFQTPQLLASLRPAILLPVRGRCSSAMLHPRGRGSSPSDSKRAKLRMSATDDPIESRVRKELAADGIRLDELLNAGKVVNLTRKLDNLLAERDNISPNSSRLAATEKEIQKIEADLMREKRQVMQLWLKRLFLAQAVLFVCVGGILANDAVPGFSIPVVGQALGFWMTWLFTIPALRARKGTSKAEKSALNVAFLATPILNIALPALTKNCGAIWAADVAVLLACYAYYGIAAPTPADSEGKATKTKEQGRVKGILKYLDWGSWR